MKNFTFQNVLSFFQVRFSFIVSLFLLFVVISGCEKPSDSNEDGNVAESFNLLHDAHQKFISLEDESGRDPHKALMLLLDWALSNPLVEDASVLDSTYLRMTLKSGLTSTVCLNMLDESDRPINRGSGSAGALEAFSEAKRCANEIENKKVLIFSPVQQEFYFNEEILEIEKTFNAASGFQLNILENELAQYDSLYTFGRYGLVIINTHGHPNGFLLGLINFNIINDGAGPEFPMSEEKVKNALIEARGPGIYERLLDGRLENVMMFNIKRNPSFFSWSDFGSKFSIWITGKGMQEMPQWDKTIIFGNFCYSGSSTVPDPLTSTWKPPYLRRAFLDRNPISYYGYAAESGVSTPISNSFAKQMEKHIIKQLVTLGDSTGNAHLDDNRNEFVEPFHGAGEIKLKLFYRDNYCFKGCDQGEGTFTDPRGNRVYKTACINNKEWMAENLDATKFRNGDDIYHAKTPEQWDAATASKTAAWCYYDYDSINGPVYGKLYNWYAVNDPRGIAPENWHVPTQQELIDLTEYYGEDAGAKLKSNVGWLDGGNGTNESKFSALPGGFLGVSALGFGGKGYFGMWWSSTEYTHPSETVPNFAFALYLINSQSDAYVWDYQKRLGLSIRCVRD